MFKEDIESLVSHLENLISTKTIVGEPIVNGNTTVIPIVTASVGFGMGSGEGQDEKNQGGKGTGGGAGMKLSPAALLIIQGDNVQVYSLSSKGSLAKLAEMIPEVIGKLKPQGKVE
ncbi:sporulation protein [Pelotomaculum terephthalicicum JT]|uniref:GerW family sporulation protein n=1 Tax=Pelotomaculum TaxID=191373 RepID=UPI0009CA2A4F|nr:MULTISPECIES: spore germination protein GerW family protein [Pelotomaculum]MCG9968795.1 sporulation protein [Pelotomaculum terephthalicicum JT]OPX86088.1 MAG: Sporulation protein YtfJ (Spore_YtfJ) [Pelotomaculum sp. PtaB.Bin117]OPY63446.1 MAG: Sporulation protein YtfJ (Spore_YtfJ) [Pelotomaculum sp. PtaU1.Bin065]